jgi:hypothetical protein
VKASDLLLTLKRVIVKWSFAKDGEAPSTGMDVRAGGAFRIGMRPADHSPR